MRAYNERMFTRVVALVLTFVLLWSGLTPSKALDAHAQPPTGQQQALAQAVERAPAHEASVTHHLNDMLSHAQGDISSETLALLPSPLTLGAEPLVVARPHTLASAFAGPPFLAGPLRPPRSPSFAG
jgi:hypothetical protein